MYLEGQFVWTNDDLVFEVKGIRHPPSRIIAYLRYIPRDSGSRVSSTGQHYTKIADLAQKIHFLETYCRSYLWYSPVHHRVLQSVRVQDVKRILDPVRCLNLARLKGPSSAILRNAVRLCQLIVESTNLDWDDLGITGSLLTGLSTDQSDIDIVVYGRRSAVELHNFLADTSAGNVLRPYSGQQLREHVRFRWSRLPQFLREKLVPIEERKKFQGHFGNTEVYIRAVMHTSDVGSSFGDLIYTPVCTVIVQCIIDDASNALFTPCEYRVTTVSGPPVSRLVSYRGRFCEHAVEGEVVQVRGTLERVYDTRTESEELWVVMGNSPSDYMLPHTIRNATL